MKNRYLATGLDLGSTATRMVTCLVEDGHVRYMGHAAVPTRGWHRGLIADQATLAESIRHAVAETEAKVGVPISSATVGVGGPSVRSVQSRGLYDFGHRRPIETEDLKYSLDLAAQTHLGEDRLLLQMMPQDFTVDGRPPMPHPLNIDCQRLEAHALLVTGSAQEHQALLSSVHQAHLRVEDTIFEPIAAAFATVLNEERAGGVCLVDIGAHSTGVVVYDGDSMLYASGLPISGDHFHRDLCELRGLNMDEAERLKIAHGCALVGLTSDNIIIELPSEDVRASREIHRRALNEILEARANQMWGMVRARCQKFAPELALREGVVLTGAACQLEGLVEVAERELSCPARLGLPRGIDDWPAQLMNPEWTTAAGLAMYSGRLNMRGTKKAPAAPGLRNLLPSVR